MQEVLPCRGLGVQRAAVAHPPNTTSLSPYSVVLWPHLLRALASMPCEAQPLLQHVANAEVCPVTPRVVMTSVKPAQHPAAT